MILTPKQASQIQPLDPEHFMEHLNHSTQELISADPTIGIEPQKSRLVLISNSQNMRKTRTNRNQ